MWLQKAKNPENQEWTTVARDKKPKVTPYIDRRVVVTPSTKIASLDPMLIRTKINNVLLVAGIPKPIVATVGLSRSRENVILTTMPDCTANKLMALRKTWEPLVDTVSMQKDAKWSRVIAHGVSTRDFETEEGMALLKMDVEIFNPGLMLAQKPMWLTKLENRAGKRHSSAILTMKSAHNAKIAIQGGLVITGDKRKVTPYNTNKPTD